MVIFKPQDSSNLVSVDFNWAKSIVTIRGGALPRPWRSKIEKIWYDNFEVNKKSQPDLLKAAASGLYKTALVTGYKEVIIQKLFEYHILPEYIYLESGFITNNTHVSLKRMRNGLKIRFFKNLGGTYLGTAMIDYKTKVVRWGNPQRCLIRPSLDQ